MTTAGRRTTAHSLLMGTARDSKMKWALMSLGLAFATLAAQVSGQDLKSQYGTQSDETAELLDRGITLVQRDRPQEGLEHIEDALLMEPKLQMGLYWQGLAYDAIGDLDKCIASYESLYQTAEPGNLSMPVEGCYNAGIALGMADRLDESALWFSRAIVLDPESRYDVTGKIYRNLAITLARDGRFTSAALCAASGIELAPDVVEQEMFDSFSERARSEVGTLLHLPIERVDLDYIDEFESSPAEKVAELESEIASLVDLTAHQSLLILPDDGNFICVIDYADDLTFSTIETQGRPKAASYVAGRLFLSLSSPDRIVEYDIQTREEVAVWRLSQPAPKYIAVAPKHELAFFADSGLIRILDLDTGDVEISDFQVTSVATDPTQEYLYAMRTPQPSYNIESGHFLIQGKPVFFQVQSDQSGDSQSTLYRLKICQKTLVMAEVRINAASNGRQIRVSPRGDFVAIVGGGGWRPLDRTAGAGYGVPVFQANDFERVMRFVETDAYPKSAAFSPVTNLFAARGGQFVLTHLVNNDEIPLEVDTSANRLPRHGTLTEFSGDGKWLFVEQGTILFAIPMHVEGLESTTSWYNELIDPR